MPVASLVRGSLVNNGKQTSKAGDGPRNRREVSPPDVNRSLGNTYLQSIAGNREFSEKSGTPRYGENGTAQPDIKMHVTGGTDRFKKSSTEPTAGGITGVTLDVTFTVSNTPAAGLQAIQTFWGTRRTDGRQVGSMTWTDSGKTYDAFVDGGKESPYVKWGGNPPAHATEPYYLTADEVKNQVTFSADSGTIKVFDAPGAVAVHDEANFETAIVAVNYNSTGKDKVLKVFDWGWTGKGTTSTVGKGTEIAGKDSGILVKGTYSPRFSSIVKHDYPRYTLS